MEFALYRYEFEVMEKKDSSTNLFPEQWDNLTPRMAFEKKSELLDELLKKDYQQLALEQSQLNTTEQSLHIAARSVPKLPLLQFTNGSKQPLYHMYATAPKDGFAILKLARRSSVSHRPHPFQENAVKEDDYKSLHIIIDNRGTHQHVAIEKKSSVFKKTDTVAASLAHALCEAFDRYGLIVKVVPQRDDKHFWEIVGDKERYPNGFKRLFVKFPQINDPEVSKGLDELGLGYHRRHFGTSLGLNHEAPDGEPIPFDENDAYQQSFMNLASLYGDIIKLTPKSGSPITFGGECAKTGEMPDSIMQKIEESRKSPDLFNIDAKSQAMECMNKFFTTR